MKSSARTSHVNVEQPRLHEELLAILDRTLDATTGRDRMRIFSDRVANTVRLNIFIRRFAPLVIQAVYLARLADLCRPGRYEAFVGGLVPQRADAFRRAVANAPQRPDLVRVTEHGAELPEPTPATGRVVALSEHRARRDETFVLHFARMPAAAAMLDILHDALGFSEVSSLLQPCLGPTATVPVREVATKLTARFDAWLKPRLASDHYVKQALFIRSFFHPKSVSRAKGVPDPDDEVIFEFWKFASLADVDLGFRLFRYAAAAMLRYDRAVQISRMRHRDPLANYEPTAEQPGRRLPNALWVDPETGEAEQPAFADRPWTSPLAELCEPPPRAVKWLLGTECRWLRNLMGGSGRCADEEDHERSRHEVALSPHRPLPQYLARTLLRVDVFGPVQDRLGGRRAPDVVGSIRDAPDTYASAAAKYRKIHSQLRTEALAALDALLRHGAWGAIPMLLQFLPHLSLDPFKTEPEPPVSGESDLDAGDRIVRNIQAQRQHDPSGGDPALAKLLLTAAKSASDRVGFRKQDDGDPACLDAMAEASVALDEVNRLLTSLLSRLERTPLDTWWHQDRDLFAEQFRKIYCDGNAT